MRMDDLEEDLFPERRQGHLCPPEYRSQRQSAIRIRRVEPHLALLSSPPKDNFPRPKGLGAARPRTSTPPVRVNEAPAVIGGDPMPEQLPFGTNDFAENPEPRCPCVLLLDTSGSM